MGDLDRLNVEKRKIEYFYDTQIENKRRSEKNKKSALLVKQRLIDATEKIRSLYETKIFDQDEVFEALYSNPSSHLQENSKKFIIDTMYGDWFVSSELYTNIKRVNNIHFKCSYCYLNNISELDHFLEKSEFPELSIMTDNLIPVCGDCNKKKNSAQKMYINPYFEKLFKLDWLQISIMYEDIWIPKLELKSISLEDEKQFERLTYQLEKGAFMEKILQHAASIVRSQQNKFTHLIRGHGDSNISALRRLLLELIEIEIWNLEENLEDNDAKIKLELIVNQRLKGDIDGIIKSVLQ